MFYTALAKVLTFIEINIKKTRKNSRFLETRSRSVKFGFLWFLYVFSPVFLNLIQQVPRSSKSCQCGHVFEDVRQIAGKRFSGKHRVLAICQNKQVVMTLK